MSANIKDAVLKKTYSETAKMSENAELSESLFKIVILGNPGVGKTSYMHKYICGDFGLGYKPTTGGI